MSFAPTQNMLWLACLFAPYSAMRVRTPNANETRRVTSSRWTQCTWTGPPKSGFMLKFPMEVSGPKGGSCKFACKAKLWELNPAMSELFRADTHRDKCRCFLEGNKNAMLRFEEATREDEWFYRFPKRYGKCSVRECWARYQSIMNFRKPKELTVSLNNQLNIPVSCSECETKADCPVEVTLPTFLPDPTINEEMTVDQTPRSPSDDDIGRNGKVGVPRTKSEADLENFMGELGIEFPGAKPKKLIQPKPIDVVTTNDDDRVVQNVGHGTQTDEDVDVLDLDSYISPKPIDGGTREDDDTVVENIRDEADTAEVADEKFLNDDPIKRKLPKDMEIVDTEIANITETPIPCGADHIPSNCIIVPGPTGDEWKQQVVKNACKGNVLIIPMKRSSPLLYSSISTRSTAFTLREYVAVQVDSTHNIADMTRTIPSGLSISRKTDGQREKVVIEHRRVAMDLTLLTKATAGLFAVISSLTKTPFPNTQKLVIEPTLLSQASWEHSRPPSLSKSLAQGALSVGAWFGAKSALPRSWVENIEYMPVNRGWCELVPLANVVPCVHSSAGLADVTDSVDELHEEDEEDSSGDDWHRDSLEDDEHGSPQVKGQTDGPTERQHTEDIDQDSKDHEETDQDYTGDSQLTVDTNDNEADSSTWEHTPVYPGFNNDSDGGFGMEGYESVF